MEFFLDAMRKYAQFTGRATRQQYWMFVLIYMVIYIVLAVIDAVLGLGFLSVIYSLVLLVPSLSAGARRLHDTDRSGWWQLIYLVPLIGLIVMIVFLVQDSHPDNQYGPNPKA
ncbi:MAG: DUF805 domain-containing protein [Marinagarivorans sp.]|nr:DUF805 domain-containing protein [Marinagarivorans sp.]